MSADEDEVLPPPVVESVETTAFGSSLATLERAAAPLMGWADALRPASTSWELVAMDLEEEAFFPLRPYTPDALERFVAVVLADLLVTLHGGGSLTEIAEGGSLDERLVFTRALLRLRGLNLPRHTFLPFQTAVENRGVPAAVATVGAPASRYARWGREFFGGKEAREALYTAAADIRAAGGQNRQIVPAAAVIEYEADRNWAVWREPIDRYVHWMKQRHP